VPTALITGASRGLGHALARSLVARGWQLIVDARDGHALTAALGLPGVSADVTALVGDVTDPGHRAALVDAVARSGRLDLLVANASDLGPSPLPALATLPLHAFRRVLETNVVAPLALVQSLLPMLRRDGGALVHVSSDAAVEAYPGWGGYGASKAALDRLTAILAVEEPTVDVYAVDPGDMRTAMHQAAFPGEDISDRPLPGTVVPAFLRLIDERPASGRYRAVDLRPSAVGGELA
jgi:NAD(P)-dependent dehydrogenase (short-subunit alcohol dehydrogenase family)